MKLRQLWLILGAALLPLLLQPGAADAQTLPAGGGLAYIGQVNGWAAIVHQSNTGVCTQIDIAPGGLTHATSVIGTNSSEQIYLVFELFGPISFCNRTMTTLVTNGHSLWITGGGGDDRISNITAPTLSMWGEGGNDILYNYAYAGESYTDGGTLNFFGDGSVNSGNDFLYVGNGGRMLGGDGNDRLCVASGHSATYAYGGNGWDTFCGYVTTSSGFEAIDCGCTP